MLYLEILLILLVLAVQIGLYLKNRQKAAALARLYPERSHLSVVAEQVNPDESAAIEQLLAAEASETFQQTLDDSNTYLRKNRGGAASFQMLKELGERPMEREESAAAGQLTTPLYTGLLGTFLGILLGLAAIVEAGVTEDSIQGFLTGVMVAMAGSFGGLLFTLLSSYHFRKARQQALQRQQDYLSFLQVELLPALEQDMASSLGGLRTVLDQFNKDFFQKIIDFKEVFANLSNYVGVQEKFLTALESSGYSRLTEANLQFFEKIQENKALFEEFGSYQRSLNESLQLGREAAGDIREVVERLRQIDDMQAYMRQNEELLRKQVGYLTAHQDRMQDLTNTIQQHFIEAGDDIGKIVQERLQILRREEQDAGEALREHFKRLQQESVYEKIAEQLQPIKQMEQEVEQMSNTTQNSSRMLLETSQYLMKKINQDSRIHQGLLEEIQELNRQVAQLNDRKSWWQRVWSKQGRP
ncbi:hypothetical protein [Nafulsella turpanensis]|uniref:hypothetical protein n=1 Tax=Nafulsella turpanensis TaxID=1265690 RepID=UPI000345940D|nr:hypothetical protein [Nafulsella turpanensis]